MRGLAGKTAAVIGAGQGIGQAVCLELSRYGVKIAAIDLEEPRETLDRLAEAGAEARGFCTDVRSLPAMQKTAQSVSGWSGAPSFVVNSVNVRSFSPILELSAAYWQNTIDVILTGGFNTARAFCPAMVEQGHGAVVFFTSITARYSFPNLSHYQAAKMGLEGLSRALAFELGTSGVRVNSVAPWLVATPNFEDRAAFFESEARNGALKRLATPEEVSRLVAFLLSDEACTLTGRELDCDMGYSLSAQDFDGWLERRGGGVRPGEDGRALELPLERRPRESSSHS
ncbi:SDR family NAD(P)-dependent oxidoreductase [Mesorhizobium sp. M1329]|uniref:SDR family NAD(P)-dependent oxidoreductase n=1 Tax=Mesorhizobium sp. M1329 TaxID=2957083 RepID=UPI003339CBAF